MDQRAPDASAAAHPLMIAAIVATAFFMESFDSTVIVTALPVMADAFGTTPVALSLGLTSYILALAVTLPASGWIADRYGVKKVFLCAIAAFTMTSMLCGLAQSLPQFVLARALQGMAGALMAPIGRLVILRSTDKKDLVRAMNFVTAPMLFGPVLGPPIGGFIATYADWRWIFFLNLPIGVLGLLLVGRFIPNLPRAPNKPFDYMGFCLNGTGLAAILFGLDLLGHGSAQRLVGAAIAAFGFLMGWLAVRHYRRIPNPLVDLSALKIPTFAMSTLSAGVLFRLSMAAPIFVLPLFLQIGLGNTAFMAGMLILAHTGGDLVIKVCTTTMLRRYGFRSMLVWSAGGFAILIGALAFLDKATPMWFVLGLLFAAGVLRSLQLTAVTSLQYADVPRDQMTGASTYAGINQHMTRAIGIALAALLLNLTAIWRGGSGDDLQTGDFRTAFIVAGLFAFASMLRYLRLPHDAGVHVSAGR